MNTIDEKLNLPSTDTIIKELGLQYDGQFEEANPDATFSFSVPVITDECPGNLRYLPLSKISHFALDENLNKESFWERMNGKKYCVIICKSFDKVDPTGLTRYTLKPQDEKPLNYIAAFWDTTEDPLMAATLYSCTFITQEAPEGSPETFERVPVFLKEDQVERWLSAELSFEEREQIMRNL